MSQSKSGAVAPETPAEDGIAEYLRSHPDFFERHPNLLLGLRLPHRPGSAVSLVERQVSMLRQRSGELERQLKDLVAVAKQNDDLVEKIHQLSVKLLRHNDVAGRLEQLEVSLREDFAAEQAVLVLFPDSKAGSGPDRPGFTQRFEREDPKLAPFSAFLRGARPRCGPIRDRQKAVLFARDADSIVSAAMVPLGPKSRLGFLVIGSGDPDHFHPAKRVDFLARIGELVAVALEAAQ
jgi:uncharacterized protein YigA (DUF484 family)